MPIYYSWRKIDEESLPAWKSGKLTYIYRGERSRKAFWVFNASSQYHPKKNITAERILIAFDIRVHDDSIIENQRYWIRFPGPAFEGETRHPGSVIVKDNEPGAFGIGADILPKLLVAKIRLAYREEVSKSLNIGASEVQMEKQKW